LVAGLAIGVPGSAALGQTPTPSPDPSPPVAPTPDPAPSAGAKAQPATRAPNGGAGTSTASTATSRTTGRPGDAVTPATTRAPRAARRAQAQRRAAEQRRVRAARRARQARRRADTAATAALRTAHETVAPLAAVRATTESSGHQDDAALQAIAGATLLGLAGAGALTMTRARRRIAA
jgi:hypothetical protein